jgi:Mn2+/Fe2+ NRAMP family transporter
VFFGLLFVALGLLFLFLAPPIGIVLITAGVSTFVLFAWMAYRSLREDNTPED